MSKPIVSIENLSKTRTYHIGLYIDLTADSRVEEHRAEAQAWLAKQEGFTDTNEKFGLKAGSKITIASGYNSDIAYLVEIFGFDAEGLAYCIWDCYWMYLNLTERLIDDNISKHFNKNTMDLTAANITIEPLEGDKYSVNYTFYGVEIEGTLFPYHTGRCTEHKFEPDGYNSDDEEYFFHENYEEINEQIQNALTKYHLDKSTDKADSKQPDIETSKADSQLPEITRFQEEYLMGKLMKEHLTKGISFVEAINNMKDHYSNEKSQAHPSNSNLHCQVFVAYLTNMLENGGEI